MKKIFVTLLVVLHSLFSFSDGCNSAPFSWSYDASQCCWVFFTSGGTDCGQWVTTWDFGDGTSPVTEPMGTATSCHSFPSGAGTYNVTLSIDATMCPGGICTNTQTITIPPLTTSSTESNYNGYNVSCEGGSDGWIKMNSAAGYTYTWQTFPVQYGDSIGGLTAGTYVVDLDFNGCAGVMTIILTEPSMQTNEVIQNLLCYGDNNGFIDLSMSGGCTPLSYLWSHGPTSEDVSNLTAGFYFVDITDAYGVIKNFQFTLTEPPLLQATIASTSYNGYNISCNGGSNGNATVTAGGGVPGYSYSWSNGSLNQSISGLNSGNYLCTITDQNGCTTTDTVEITEPTLNIQESVTDVSCFGGINGAVSVTVSGSTAPYYVFWDNNINTNLLSAGTYGYQIIDSIGCNYNDSLIVSDADSFVVVENITNVSCNGFNNGEIILDVTGATPPYIVDWFGVSTSNMNAGTYNFTILDSNNCAYSEIAIVSEPNQIDVLNQVVDPSCGNTNDGSVSLLISGGTPAYSVNWGVNNPNSLAIGTYEFVIIDDNNCVDSNSVTLIPESNIQVIADVTEISCNSFCDGAIDLQINGGVAPYIVDWFGLNSAALCEGLVSYNLIDALGCSYSESFLMVPPDSVELIINQIGMQLEANASGGVSPYSYEWFNDLGSLISSQNVNITSNGNYYCIAIDANNCQSDTITYFYSETSINDSEISSFNIYPNPSEGFLILECTSIQNSDLTVNLIDVLGQYVNLDTKKSFTGDYKNQIDLYNYAKGVYFINIKLNNQNHYKKLILE